MKTTLFIFLAFMLHGCATTATTDDKYTQKRLECLDHCKTLDGNMSHCMTTTHK